MYKIILLILTTFMFAQTEFTFTIHADSSDFLTENGYYIYKFGIDNKDNITLYTSKYVNEKLKVSKITKHIYNPILYKLINIENNILFEGEFINPKTIYYEDMINKPHTKSIFILDSTYFIIKVPAFDSMDRIEFFNFHGSSKNLKKIGEIKLSAE